MFRFLADYGMLLVLLALCVLFSVLTIEKQTPTGEAAADQLVRRVNRNCGPADVVLVVGKEKKKSADLANIVMPKLQAAGFANACLIVGVPRDLRAALDDVEAGGQTLAAIVTAGDVIKWPVLEQIDETHSSLAGYQRIVPEPYYWPKFLKTKNLVSIVDKIVVIAIIAIGMTMVIVTAGIDLSVGSLIALSAIVGTLVMKYLGGPEASAWVVLLGFLIAISTCGAVSGFGGFLVARFKVPPFITTLAIMMMARGMARILCGGYSIEEVPKTLHWLGQERTLGIPNTVLLLAVLYVIAHVFMSHTRLGRYIYAVGGNEEAARLSGVPVMFVIVFVYVVSGMAAGLGGCIWASKLNSGTPNIGNMYELYVIAAVVVGGTSLSGGSGRIFGTLIGAFIIAVIQNGMNLMGLKSSPQLVVLGAVILGAVLVDKLCSGAALSSLIKKQFHA